MKTKLKENKAITLIALVITIVILIILAAVIINITIGKNGIITRTKEAIMMRKKAQYIEEIQLEITDEYMERLYSSKNETFIISLQKRLGGTPIASLQTYTVQAKKDWVKSTIINLNTILVVYTIDDYQILIDVDNENNTATIRKESFAKKGKECTITFDGNTGTGNVENIVISEGLYIELPNNGFTKQYYEFVGWYKNSEGDGERYNQSEKYLVTKDETFYAKWSQNAITISYNAGFETETSMSDTMIEVGKKDNLLENTYTKIGYTFTGWKDQDNNEYEDEQEIVASKNLQLVAQWELKEYTINYMLNGGTLASTNPTSYTIETDSFTLNNPVHNAYTFIGWSGTELEGNDNIIVTIPKGSTGNRMFTANWKSEEKYRYVKFNITKLRGIPQNGCIQLSEFTFWNNSGEKYIYNNTNVTSSISGYSNDFNAAKIIDNNTNTKYCSINWGWGNYATGNCNIVFDFGENNKIDLAQYSSYTYTTGDDATNRDPISWTLMASNDNINYILIDKRESEPITESRKTQTSKYYITVPERDEDGMYSISFDTMGGSNGPNKLSSANQNTFTIPQTIPTKQNFIFNRWSTNMEGTGSLYNTGDSIVINNKTTLYAKWVEANSNFRYIKINISKIRNATNVLQFSELNFADDNGNKFSYPLNTGIYASLGATSSNESIYKVIDNSANTKYCTTGWGGNQTGSCVVTIDLGVNNYLDISRYKNFSYTTGDDASERDPISWEISVSNDNTNYYNVCSVNNASITTNRKTQTQNFSIAK